MRKYKHFSQNFNPLAPFILTKSPFVSVCL